MTGREENKIKIDNKIKEKLRTQPRILNEYFAYLSNNGRDSATTRRIFVSGAIRFSNWLMQNGINLRRVDNIKMITPGMLNTYLLEVGENVKPKTKADYYINLKSFFEFLKNMEYIDKSPFDSNKIPKQKYNAQENVVYLTEEEIGEVRENIRNSGDQNALMYETLFTLGYKTGVRITALTEININDINIDKKLITVTDKENITRDVYIGDSMIELLNKYLEYRLALPTKSNALFVARRYNIQDYERITYRKALRFIKQYASLNGKNITPHKLRDTCAMLTYGKSHDIFLTGEVLGHRNIENTRKYVRVTEDRRRDVAEFLDQI